MSGATYDELIERSPVGLLVVELGGTVRAHNRVLAEWLGAAAGGEADALRGRNIVEWLAPASRLFYETRLIPDLLRTGTTRGVVIQARDGAGHTRSLLTNARLQQDEGGESLVYAAVMDVEDRIDYERQMLVAQRAADVAQQRLSLLQEATSRLAVARGLGDLGDALVDAALGATQAGWVAVRRLDEPPHGGAARYWGTVPPGIDIDAIPELGAEATVCRNRDEVLAFPEAGGALAAAGVESLVVMPIVRAAAETRAPTVLGEIHCWLRRSRTLDAEVVETLHALAAQADRVVDHIRLQEQMRHRALHDGLTGLPNRLLTEERLEQVLAAAQRTGDGCAVLFVDLDGFKAINDQRGHAAGDEVLIEVAGRLRHACRAEDTAGRLGGDEFVVAAARLDEGDAAELAARIADAVREPLTGLAEGMPLSCSIGLVHWDPRADAPAPTAEELVAEADVAMYGAKRAGKDAVVQRRWGA